MKRISGVIFLSVCLLFCLLIGVSAVFSQADAEVEQRELTAFPSFFDEDGSLNKNFDSELSDYLSERMPFRSAALEWKSTLLEKLFASSTASDVIIGKNGWLYFEPTIAEYTATSLLSERSIANIVDTLSQINDYCEQKGVKFVFTVAPNKNELYDENLPLRFLKGEGNNYDRLTEALRQTDIPYVDFHDLAGAAEEPLYYATDSHWNVRGAVIAYDALLTRLAIEHETYQNVSWIESEKNGDLYGMLHPADMQPETEWVPDVTYTYEYTSRFRSEEDITITTENTTGNGSLLMFRDSFGNALLAFLAQHFSTAYFSRAVPCDLTLVDSLNADTVIYEMVQRNLANIISYAPVLPAAEAELTADEESEQSVSLLQTQAHNGLLHIFGALDEQLLQTDSKLYLRLTSPNGEAQYFRCFSIYEASLAGDGLCRDNGFSGYLDTAALPRGDYRLSVCVESGGEVIAYPTEQTVTVE